MDRRIPPPATVVSWVPDTPPLVALTVDDGVSSPVVGAYVALAQATGIRLTFFANGVNRSWAKHQREMQPLVDSGQIHIANHTWDHPLLTSGAGGKLRYPPRVIRAEIARTTRAIERAGVPRPMMFRPPYGHGVFSRPLQGIAAAQGELTVGWHLALDHFLLNRWPVRANGSLARSRIPSRSCRVPRPVS